MGKIWMPGGGGGTDSCDCTATKDKVLSGYTAVTKDSDDEAAVGTMANCGAVSQALNAGGSYTIPAGYHNGSGKVTANALSGQTSGTATATQILSGQTAWVNGSRLTGSMANQGTKTSALNCGGSYTIPAGYHNGSGKVTANSLASQTGGATAGDGDVLSGKTFWKDGAKRTGTMPYRGGLAKAESQWFGNGNVYFGITAGAYTGAAPGDSKPQVYRTAAELGISAANIAKNKSICGISGNYTSDANAAAGDIRSGKTGYVNGNKITGNLAVQSAISFSAAALSTSSVRISWKNPAKGPWQGVFIQMSTSGYPGTGGGSRVYTGAGSNPKQAGGSNYIDITALSMGTQYYFTCTSYVDNLGWGSSHNISTRIASIQSIFANVFGSSNLGGGKTMLYTARPGSWMASDLYMSYIWWDGQTEIPNSGLRHASSGNLICNSRLDTFAYGACEKFTVMIRVDNDGLTPLSKLMSLVSQCRVFKKIHIDSTGYNSNSLVDHWDWDIESVSYELITGSTEKYHLNVNGYYIKFVMNAGTNAFVSIFHGHFSFL